HRTQGGAGGVHFFQGGIDGGDGALGTGVGADVDLLDRGIRLGAFGNTAAGAGNQTEVCKAGIIGHCGQSHLGVCTFVSGDELQLTFVDRGANFTLQSGVAGNLLVDVVSQRFQSGVAAVVDSDGLGCTAVDRD